MPRIDKQTCMVKVLDSVAEYCYYYKSSLSVVALCRILCEMLCG